MSGWKNGVMWSDNVNFSGDDIHDPQVLNDGELLIGSSVAPNIRVSTITSNGGSITISNGPGTINIEAAAGTGDVMGPGASTDNAIARWDGGSGTLIQNSTAILDDAGVITSATWNGNTITVPYGGTGAISLTGVLTGNGVSPFTASTVSQYNVLLGGTSNLVVSQPPSATIGYPLVSQGPAANPDFTGSVNLAAGALGSPTLTWAGDSTTGFYSSGANVLDFVNSGNHVFSITSSAFDVLQSLKFETQLLANSFTIPNADYIVTNNDCIIYCNKAGAMNVTLEAFPPSGKMLFIADYAGAASTNNITILGNGKTINGSASFVINVDHGAILIQYNNSSASWNVLASFKAQVLEVTEGGTGATTASGARTNLGITNIATQTVTQYDVLVGGAANAITSIGPGLAGQVFQSAGAAANPAYSTATYPATATGTGTFLRADGTNWVASTSTLPNTNAQGDIIYGSASNVWTSLAKDTNATRYLSNTGTNNNPAWAQINLSNGVTGNLPISNRLTAVTAPGSYPYTTLSTDELIIVDTSSARTINLMVAPPTGMTYRIKDNVGSAASNNITIVPAAGNIDGAANLKVTSAYGSVDLTYNGTQWNAL